MSEIEHLVMPALRAAGRPTTCENQERMRKALTEAAHARAEAVGVLPKYAKHRADCEYKTAPIWLCDCQRPALNREGRAKRRVI